MLSRARLLVAGVMSGTSADGADVAVVRIARAGAPRWRCELLAFAHSAYPPALRRRVLAAATGAANAGELARLDAELGRHFARAVRRAARRLPPGLAPELVACHGQTVFHQGRLASLQLGSPAALAAAGGLPVVSDFRSADIAQGGEGAPLVPWADWHLFGHPRRLRIALNLGGIANLTLLAPELCAVSGFDTGPGHMALDAFVQ
ncbi:MAG: anhydro-N-acetylmuramic acid kinase, partial [Terriglobales bacterium]